MASLRDSMNQILGNFEDVAQHLGAFHVSNSPPPSSIPFVIQASFLASSFQDQESPDFEKLLENKQDKVEYGKTDGSDVKSKSARKSYAKSGAQNKKFKATKRFVEHRKLCRKRQQGICPICNGWLPFTLKKLRNRKFQEQKQAQRYQTGRIKKLRKQIIGLRKTGSTHLKSSVPPVSCQEAGLPDFPCICGLLPVQNVLEVSSDLNSSQPPSHQMPLDFDQQMTTELCNQLASNLVEFMFPAHTADPADKQNLAKELIKLFEIIEKEKQLLAENRERIESKESRI